MSSINQSISIYALPLQKYALFLTNNTIEAEDLVQETMLKILTKSDRFKKGTNFKAWAMTIMRNLFINDFRKKRRQRSKLGQDASAKLAAFEPVSSTRNGGELNLSCEEINTIIEQLPGHLRIPFVFRLEGYKYDEIAEKLDLPLGTVKSQVFHAKKMLQKKYELATKLPDPKNN